MAKCYEGACGGKYYSCCCSNRVGQEVQDNSTMTFYGSSFISGPDGEIINSLNREEEGYLIAEFDLDEINGLLGSFSRSPSEMYETIMHLDGKAHK